MEPLSRKPLLVLDCQSTGASPAHGSLLEVGWAITTAVAPTPIEQVTAELIALPEGQSIPRQVTRVTGVRAQDVLDARSEEQVWSRLIRDASALSDDTGLVPTIVHYARFENAFLRDLRQRVDPARGFPFEMVCTHEIARRLLPDLPRRSLRALAGYYGFAPELLRRSRGHVAATAFVWQHLVAHLDEHGVTDWDALRRWLEEATPVSSRARVYPMGRDKRLSLPDAPGVYRMLRTSGDVLYVGKAISLKRRVNSYFQKQRGVSERLLEMLSQARDLDVTVTDSAIEAAMLESDEIKRHAPPYNVALREEQRDAWFARRDLRDASTRPDESHCIGPLPSRRSLLPLLDLARLIRVDARSVSPAEARAALGIPVGHRLDAENVALGFEWFTRTHRPRLPPSVEPERALLALGAALWRDRGELPRDDEDDKDDDAPWPPGRVTSELERMVMVAVQLIRRARWLCLLSEASVAWQASRVAGEGWRQLVLEGGAVIERSYLDRPEPALPPGHGRPPHQRRVCFDVIVYDRLRTLSTELKRVLAEPGGVAVVRVGERAVVSGERLVRVLRSV